MNNEKIYSKSDVCEIIDKAIKAEMQRKNDYIAKNGFSHVDTIKAFDNRVSALCGLYYYFS